jgi:uncharacterized membrane protein
MKSNRAALLLFCVLLGIFIAVLLGTSSLLPERVATHFDAAGNPNGWMTRNGAIIVMGVVGLLLPLFIVSTGWLLRILPTSLINLPHKEYWLAPEHREETSRWLTQFFVWVGCLLVVFLTALHLMVVAANRSPAPRLSSVGIYSAMAVFISLIALAAVKCFEHFRRIPA